MRTAEGFDVHLVTDEPRKGLLGSLGMKETAGLTTYVCPECGLVRQYVEAEE